MATVMLLTSGGLMGIAVATRFQTQITSFINPTHGNQSGFCSDSSSMLGK